MPPERKVDRFAVRGEGGTLLRGEAVRGSGPTALLLHGLTAHRGLVVMGSRLLEKAGWTVIAFDARGHGESEAAAGGSSYGYPALIADAQTVIESEAGPPVVGIGASMGAHTLAGLALRSPDLFAGLVLVTPAFAGPPVSHSGDGDSWDALAAALETGGIDSFVSELAGREGEGRWSATVAEAARQRMGRHSDLDAVASALREVPASLPFPDLDALRNLQVPTVVVASRDEADPTHPYAVARAWAESIPGSRLLVEAEGESPLAWRGARLSEIALELVDQA